MTTFKDIAGMLDSYVDARVYSADAIPDDVTYPCVGVSLDAFPTTPALAGDARTQAWAQLVQVDLWQRLDAESEALRDSVVDALNGAKGTEGRMRAQVESVVRAPEPLPSELVHDAITLRIARSR